jgi:5-methylcytosine-specific restriction protein B
MFIDLFDESKDIVSRISDFKAQSSILLEKHGNGAKQHFQYENAVSTYLWLRYPDKYYIYKYGEIKTVAEVLVSDYRFKKGAYADNMRSFYRFYDELCTEIKKDEELLRLLRRIVIQTRNTEHLQSMSVFSSAATFRRKISYLLTTGSQQITRLIFLLKSG